MSRCYGLHVFLHDESGREKNQSRAITARKVSKYGVFSAPFFALFTLNTEIYSE